MSRPSSPWKPSTRLRSWGRFAQVPRYGRRWRDGCDDREQGPHPSQTTRHEQKRSDRGMNDGMRTGMAEATQLTREGKLLEATALIQQTLGVAHPPVTPRDVALASGGVVDGAHSPTADVGTGRDGRREGPGPAGAEPELRLRLPASFPAP